MNPRRNAINLPFRRISSYPNVGASEAAHDLPTESIPGTVVGTVDDLHRYDRDVIPYRQIRDQITEGTFNGNINQLYGQLRLVMRQGSVANYVYNTISRPTFPQNQIIQIANEIIPDVGVYALQTPTSRVVSVLFERVAMNLRRRIARPLLQNPVTFMEHPVAQVFMERVVRVIPAQELRAAAARVDQGFENLLHTGLPSECLKHFVRSVRPIDMPLLMNHMVDNFWNVAHQNNFAEIMQTVILKGPVAHPTIKRMVDVFTNEAAFEDRSHYHRLVSELIGSYFGSRTLDYMLDNASMEDRMRVCSVLATGFPHLVLSRSGLAIAEKMVQYCNVPTQFAVAAVCAPIDFHGYAEGTVLFELLRTDVGRQTVMNMLGRFDLEPTVHIMFHLNFWYYYIQQLEGGQEFINFLTRSGLLHPTPLVWRNLAPDYWVLGLPFHVPVENADDHVVDVAHMLRNARPTLETAETDIPIIPVQADDNTNFPYVTQRGNRLIVDDPVLKFFNGAGVNPERNEFTFDFLEGRFMAFACDPHGSKLLYHRLTNEHNTFTDDQQYAMMRELAPFAQVASVAPYVGRVLRQLLVNGRSDLRDLFAECITTNEMDLMSHNEGCELAMVAITRDDNLGRQFKTKMLELLEIRALPTLSDSFRALVDAAMRVIQPPEFADAAIAHIRLHIDVYDLATVVHGPSIITSILARPPSPQRFAVMADLVETDERILESFNDPGRRTMIRSLIGAAYRESPVLFDNIERVVMSNVEAVFKAPHSWEALRVLFENNPMWRNMRILRYILNALPQTDGEIMIRAYSEGDAGLMTERGTHTLTPLL